jgi:hypothetical protein
MSFNHRGIFSFIFAIGTMQFAFAEGAGRPEVWMCKSNPWELADSGDWEFVKENVDGIKIYIDEMKKASEGQMKKLAAILNENDTKIAIELAGLADWRAKDKDQTAALSFQDEWAKVKRLVDAGGKVYYLDIDGPIRRLLYPGHGEPGYHTVDSATDELVKVLKLWLEACPGVKFMLTTNFPNWGWKHTPAYHNFGFSAGVMGQGDYFPAVKMAVEKAKAAGIPFDGVTIDNPYSYALGERKSNQPDVTKGVDWFWRVLDLEQYARSEGLEVTFIYNSERAGDKKGGSGELFAKETLEYIDLHMAKGGAPDRYMMQSWYHYPTKWVPEETPGTMTNLVKQVIEKTQK